MALVLKDRVKETTTTTGTGTYTLAGAVAGFEAFSEIGNSNTTYYCCTDGTDFEVGIGTYTASGTTLARTTILQSSNSDNAVNWSSGSRTIFCTQPAEKAVFLNASNNIELGDNEEIKLGDSGDLRILHSGGNSFIIDDGDGDLFLRASNNHYLQFANSEYALLTTENGGVELRHNNSKKFETTSAGATVTGNIAVTGTVDGRDLATDGTKLDGIEASADVTDTTNVTAAGALMDSEVTNLAQVKAFDSSDYATAAQGTTADAALPKAGGTMTGNLTLNNVNLLFEGSTADANETVITAKDPTADNIIYVPDSSGTLRVVQRKNITGDLAVGWRTIAVLEGRDSRSLSNQRLIAKFTVADIDTSRHIMFSFRAQHSFGQDNALQVENYSTFGADSITGVRIKASTTGNGIYAGAVIQIYVADANNAIIVYLDENDLENGQDDLGRVILKDGIADATDPGNVGYSTAGYSSLTEQVQIDLQRIEPGGIATTGDFYTYSDIKFEGSTVNNANETTLTVTSPTADRTITLPDATGQVVLSDGAIDTEASAEIGRAHIGAMGHSDFAGFSHIDQNGTGSYALLQHSGGGTHLNAASGNSINFNINNANVMNMDDAGLYFYSGKVIIFEGSTDDANETTLTVADPTTDRTITLPDATGTVQLTDGSGASLTSLNASQLSSGTVPNARLDAQLQDVAGLAVTNGNFIVGDGSNFVAESGATARTSLGLGSIATQAADSVNIDGGAIDGVTIGTNSAVTELQVDNININSSTISTTTTNQSLFLTPNGIGDVIASADTFRVGDTNADATITTNGTGDLTLNTNTGTNSGSIVIADGANGNISITPDGTGVLDVISTDDGSSIGPKLHLYRNSASPADFDDMGGLVFTANNSAGDRHEYSLIRSEVADVTDGSEDAYIQFFTNVGGSSLQHMSMAFGGTTITGQLYLAGNTIHSNPHIKFEGSTANSFETSLYVTDPTADRTITLPDATGTVQLTDGSGASLTSLNASQLSSGTIPNARLDAQLQDVAGLAVTNGGFIVGDGSNFVLETGATARTSLGLGSVATQASNNVSITGGSVSGITDLAIADGGTGASSASAARTNLGLGTIATQAADSVNIDGGAIDGVTIGTNTVASQLRVDNLRLDGNHILSLNTNGGINLEPNGTGNVNAIADTLRIGDQDADATITTHGTGDLTLNTNSGTKFWFY